MNETLPELLIALATLLTAAGSVYVSIRNARKIEHVKTKGEDIEKKVDAAKEAVDATKVVAEASEKIINSQRDSMLEEIKNLKIMVRSLQAILAQREGQERPDA